MKMKKRLLRERRAALKEEVVELDNEVKELTKAALMTKAKEMGLEVSSRMTKADLEKLIKEA
jgi:hypothetical protein